MQRQDNQEIFEDFCAAVESTEQRQLRLAQLEQQQAKESKAMQRQVDLDNMEWWIANGAYLDEQTVAESESLYDGVKTAIFDSLVTSEHKYRVHELALHKFLQGMDAHWIVMPFLRELRSTGTISISYWWSLYVYDMQMQFYYK